MIRRALPIVALLLLAAGMAYAFWPQPKPDDLNAVVVSTPDSIEGFARAEGVAPLTFPADFGPHPDFQTEWWYYTGNLEIADGSHFGYQLTFFRRGLLPPSQLPGRGSDWATNQIYMAHFTLTDVEGETFQAYERFSRGAAGLAGAQADPYRVWLEDWQVELTAPNTYHLIAANENIAIDLTLRDSKGPILQGDQGYSQKGTEPGNASYYYSQTRLETRGEVSVDGLSFAVTGLTWKDHEYSTAVLGTDEVGWDWFSLQFSDGYELMLYSLRHADGSVDPYSSGTLIAPDGSTTHLELEDFVIEAQDSWRSPASGAEYPMGWLIRIPAQQLEFEITPYLRDQELDLTFIYWEGAVHVSGTHAGAAISGVGYVELTGYAAPFNGQF
jgi:predicted secreted hydrolase